MGKSRKPKRIFSRNKENQRKHRKLIFQNNEILRKIREEREFQRKLIKKWSCILEPQLNENKKNWSDFSHGLSHGQVVHEQKSKKTSFDINVIPLAMNIATQTVGLNLVNVAPMGGVDSFDEESYINEKRKTILNNMFTDTDTNYDKLEKMKEDFTTKSGGPSGKLFYMDFVYGNQKNVNKKPKK